MVTACPRGVVRGEKAGHKFWGEVNFFEKNSTLEAQDTSEENLHHKEGMKTVLCPYMSCLPQQPKLYSLYSQQRKKNLYTVLFSYCIDF